MIVDDNRHKSYLHRQTLKPTRADEVSVLVGNVCDLMTAEVDQVRLLADTLFIQGIAIFIDQGYEAWILMAPWLAQELQAEDHVFSEPRELVSMRQEFQAQRLIR